MARAKKMLAKDHCNFFYTFEETAMAVPNTVFLHYQGKEWTYMQSKLVIQQWGNYFLSQGVKPRGIPHEQGGDVDYRPRCDGFY